MNGFERTVLQNKLHSISGSHDGSSAFNALLRKSMEWFLYDNGLRRERVNPTNYACPFGGAVTL